MSLSLITSEGLLNAPGPSNANEANVIMETSSECTNEDELHGQSDIDDYIPPSQQRKRNFASRGKRPYKNNASKPVIENRRKRRRIEPAAEERIDQAECAIKAIKWHMEKGTCQDSLKYRARAKIRADNDFKLDIKRICKDAEREVLKALTRFAIDRYRIEIKKSKRPRISEASNPCKTLTKTARSASAVNNNQTPENIQASIAQFSEMMEKLGDTTNKQVENYTSVFSDSHHKHGAIGKRSKTCISNKKRKEPNKIKQQKPSNIKTEANKKQIQNLSDKELTNDQINLLAKGLKFIPTPVTKEIQVREQLLRDFDQFEYNTTNTTISCP